MKAKPTNPVVQGKRAVFEWRGPKAPRIIADFNHWDPKKAILLEPAGRNLWRYSIELPEDAYIEYAYLLDGKRVLDPGNSQHIFNGINAYNNYFYMPAGQATGWVKRDPTVPQGMVRRLKVDGKLKLSDENHSLDLFEREVFFYQPPVEEAVPLLVVFDGPDYLRRVKLPTILDNLIYQKRVRPLALAMIANGRKNRLIEYGCSDITLGFLQSSLLPLARKELKLLDPGKHPGSYGVLGASMGGLMALYTGLRMADVFGNVLSQSGAFYPGFVVGDLVRFGLGKQVRIWMDVGTFEYLIGFNRQMHTALVENGYKVHYQEYHAGHNYTAWRDDLIEGLEQLFGL